MTNIDLDLVEDKVEEAMDGMYDTMDEAARDFNYWMPKYATLAMFTERNEEYAVDLLMEIIGDCWRNDDREKEYICDAFNLGSVNHEFYDEGTPFEDYSAKIKTKVTHAVQKVDLDNIEKATITELGL